MKTITINGREFEAIHSDNYCNVYNFHYEGKTLNKFYKKSSKVKQEIYEDWHKWASETDEVEYFQVRGANGFTFTLEALYVKNNQVLGYILITKSHNYLYLPKI